MNKGTFKLMLKKNSPRIKLIVGVGLVAAGTIEACRKMKAMDAVLTEHHAKLDELENADENTDVRREKTKIYGQTCLEVGKTIGPAVVMWGSGMFGIVSSHKDLSKRNASLGAAAMMFKRKSDALEKNLIAEKGEDFAKKVLYGAEKKEIEYEEEQEDGTVKTVKKKEMILPDIDGVSDYARFFDSSCEPNWRKNSEYNLAFLKSQERIANQMLQARGYLFLNDVYNLIGLEKTKAGQVVGWIYDPDDQGRENCIDFGIYNMYSDASRRFVNGYENVILLDFNVDGEIIEDFHNYSR